MKNTRALGPDNAEIYSENSKAYIAELDLLNEEYKNIVDKVAQRGIINGKQLYARIFYS